MKLSSLLDSLIVKGFAGLEDQLIDSIYYDSLHSHKEPTRFHIAGVIIDGVDELIFQACKTFHDQRVKERTQFHPICAASLDALSDPASSGIANSGGFSGTEVFLGQSV